MRLLIVEDEDYLARLLSRGFAEEGYTVDVAGSGALAFAMASANDYDAAIFDVMLPDADGMEVCARLRRSEWSVPVLMLTARDTVSDRIRGLDNGADDYLCKPFSFGELCARVRAVTRRSSTGTTKKAMAQLRNGRVRMDPVARRVWSGHAEVYLSAREFVLLELLLLHKGEVLSRSRIYDHVWGLRTPVTSNVVDQYIRYLRHKVGSDVIETVRGVGYRIPAEPS